MDKRRLIKYVVIVLICAAVAFSYISAKGLKGKIKAEQYRIIADGFTIPGLLVTCFGLLMVIADTGTLDGVMYGVQMAFMMLTFQLISKNKDDTYAEFKERREAVRELRKQRGGGFGYLLVTGLAFVAVAIVFVILFLKATGEL